MLGSWRDTGWGHEGDAGGETLDVAMKGMQVGLLIGYECAEKDAFPREVFDIAIVAKKTIVLHNLNYAPCSFAMLISIICICQIFEYPQAMKYTLN